jgi:hypothetical protein
MSTITGIILPGILHGIRFELEKTEERGKQEASSNSEPLEYGFHSVAYTEEELREREINIGDLGDMVNFNDGESLFKKTGMQRMEDRVLGAQNSYNGELQGAICSVARTLPKTRSKIMIDNEAVVNLGKKITAGEEIELRKQQQPHIEQ